MALHVFFISAIILVNKARFEVFILFLIAAICRPAQVTFHRGTW